MGRYRIGPLHTILLLSATTITTTASFLLPRLGRSHIAPSLAARQLPLALSSWACAATSAGRSSAGLFIATIDNGNMKRPLSATASSAGEETTDEPTDVTVTVTVTSKSTPTPSPTPPVLPEPEATPTPLYLEEGLFAVQKPLGWTSQDVVGKLRFLLESDAKSRNAPDRRTKRRRPWMKVGHGGTLDPLATGVLVCGVGAGTKDLQKYLVGSKAYRAEVTLGYQTTTLDSDPKAEIVEKQSFDHVTSMETIDEVLQSKFTGNIQQIPPVFSALKRDGKKLYELGRQGQTAEDLKIQSREVIIYDLKLVGYSSSSSSSNESGEDKNNESKPPIEKFFIEVECGGGTYIRSLVRDIGIALGTVATMTKLERTKQGQFLMEHSLPYSSSDDENDVAKLDENGGIVINKREDCNWTVDAINEAIRTCRETLLTSEDDGLKEK